MPYSVNPLNSFAGITILRSYHERTRASEPPPAPAQTTNAITLRLRFLRRHLAAVSRAAALALARVLALTSMLFFYFLGGTRVVLRGRRSVRAGCEVRGLDRGAGSR